MKTDTFKTLGQMLEPEILTDETALSVGIGQRVSELLNLKINKIGRIETTWGAKSIQGLGACIQRIIEEETERLK